ncbi:MAG: N-acetylmuramoyl-L-alanine amidase [Chloroflexi bacterium]|nr:N-acetylmuramoyl-L-alanine amidase [Chloroflexota bacterium]
MALLFVLALLTGEGPIPTPKTRAESWVQASPEELALGTFSPFVPSYVGGGIGPGGTIAYLSPVKKADFSFNAVGLQWQGDTPQNTMVSFAIRSSPDNKSWSEWIPAREVDQLIGYDARAIDLIFADGKYVQYKANLSTEDKSLMPSLDAVTVTFIDSSQGPGLGNAKRSAKVMAAGPVPQPPIISRAGWGADESYRYQNGSEVWPPEYRTVVKSIVHHTATANEDSNPAATVRAIYYYHAVTLGWGDIGYNYLIDRYGNIYEGRYGGDNVVGAHTYNYNQGTVGIAALGTYQNYDISAQLQSSLVNLLSWDFYVHGIDPLGSSYFVDQVLPNIMGHRDAMPTQCPGDNFYARLPTIRTLVAGGLPTYGETWIGHKTPAALGAGKTWQVEVTVKNSGKVTWLAGGSNPFRLGYHWYDSAGNAYNESPSLEYHTPLPYDVAPGATVTVNARLLVPQKTGNYTLKWDMVQEWITWFAQQGNATLDVPVVVLDTKYGAQWGNHNTPTTMAPGETRSVNVEVQNIGWLTWNKDKPHPIDLGYHWYDQTGKQYVQDPTDDRRSPLPQNVSYGQKVTIPALLTSPKIPGTYTLKWDLVHEGVTWFADQGSKTLNVSVNITPQILPVAPSSLSLLTTPGAAPVNLRLYLQPYGNDTITWKTLGGNPSWLQWQPTSGTVPSTITVTISPGALGLGTHLAEIKIEGYVDTTLRYATTIPVQVVIVEQLQRQPLPYAPRR